MATLRNAPRREVVSIKRVGGHGSVTWQHELDCGHVELRKRKAAGPKLGCKRCLRDQFGESPFLNINEVDDYWAQEVEATEIRNRLARRLRIPPDLVTVVPVQGGFSATVVCPPQVVAALLG